jgi:hypothetical protein
MPKHVKRNFPEDVLPILNGGYRAEYLGFLAGIPAPMPGFQSAPEEIRNEAVSEFRATFRGLVDQWIDSGRLHLKERGEEPWERSIDVSTFDSKRIIDTLLEYCERNPPRFLLSGHGRFEILAEPLLRFSAWPSPPPEFEVTLQRARDNAIFTFVQFLDSPTRERLFRCDRCGKYFVRKRMPRKAVPIKLGSYCGKRKCESAGAVRRVSDGRNNRTEEMLAWAAEAWMSWNPASHRDRRQWVVQKVNAKLERSHIAVNWVTRHRGEIEEEVERRSHGTQKTR